MHDSTVSTREDPARLHGEVRSGHGEPGGPVWLVLTHHLPPEPAYLRVKVRRRLIRIGAVALKNSVYVLPSTDDAEEDFQWLLQEIEREGGDATLCEARFLDRTTSSRLVEQFREAHAAEYEDVTRSIEGLLATDHETRSGASEGVRDPVPESLRRIEQRLATIEARDVFQAPGRVDALTALDRLRTRAAPRDRDPDSGELRSGDERPRARTWVTRAGIKEDRMASAWLIRRFVDPAARFKFVPARGYEPEPGELRFDMFDGEFTHEGDLCTFEVLLNRFDLADPALRALADIVHDIDVKDDRYGRPETAGIASLIDGIRRSHDDDEARLERGHALFDELYRHFQGRPRPTP